MDVSVDFESDLFKPYLPDDCQVNPGRFGAELMYWLSRKLAERGMFTSYPSFEDWGWLIEFTGEQGEEYWLCGANVDGSQTQWRCTLKPMSTGIFRRKAFNESGAAPLLDLLNSVLEAEPAIRNVAWNRAIQG